MPGWLPACLRVRNDEAERTEKALDNTSMAPIEPALLT
jgi:hypothetical protein